MKRALQQHILNDLPHKIVLLSGPRQTGKTTLSKQLYANSVYLNYDASEDRYRILKKNWDREKQLVIFDELHKMRDWKRWLKGLYDVEGIPPEILVTGSAKLDVHRRVGDSLAGRYFQHRLHPLDVKEACGYYGMSAEEAFDALWHCGGFPEPFLKNDPVYYRRWRATHVDIILRQDLISISSVRDIDAIQTLVMLLRQRAGSTVSYANLARDLERDAGTIKRWLVLLENLYIIYRVSPYSKKIARSLLKDPKFYFYDHALVDDNDGAHLENIVASALIKELHFLEDTQGVRGSLHYLRTKDGKEIDFLVCLDGKPVHLYEVKMSKAEPAKAFRHFEQFLPGVRRTQLVKNLPYNMSFPDGLRVERLINWLRELDLSSHLS